MSAVAEAAYLLHDLVGPRRAGESVKTVLRRASSLLPRASANRVKDLWYADRRIRVHADEITHLRRIENAALGVPRPHLPQGMGDFAARTVVRAVIEAIDTERETAAQALIEGSK